MKPIIQSPSKIGLACALLLGSSALIPSAAFAQGSVAFSGVIDLYAGKRNLAGESANAVVDSGGMTTSRIAIEGQEDLGQGLKAEFGLSGFLRADTGQDGRFGTTDGGFKRFAFVGVKGNWGGLRLGRQTTPTFLTAIRYSPFADSTTFGPYAMHVYSGGQPVAAPMNVPDSASSNAISYTSPSFSGLTLQALYSPGEVSTDKSQKRWVLGGNYVSGNFSAGFGVEQSSVVAGLPTNTSKIKNLQLGAAYDLKVVKLFGQYSDSDMTITTGSSDYSTVQLGASAPYGKGLIMASVARTEKKTTAIADVKRTTAALGYDYLLSKRTDLYAVALHDTVTSLESGTTVVVGVRHRF